MDKIREAFELEMGFEMLRFEWSESDQSYRRNDGTFSPTINDAFEMFKLGYEAAEKANR